MGLNKLESNSNSVDYVKVGATNNIIITTKKDKQKSINVEPKVLTELEINEIKIESYEYVM